MISKELLCEVLGRKIKYIEDEHNGISYITEDSSPHTEGRLNIHELAYKCKEWAFDNEYILKSYKNEQGKYGYVVEIDIGSIKPRHNAADTEPEAIFKACEWILKQEEV